MQTSMKTLAIAALAAFLSLGAAQASSTAQAEPAAREARIPFVNHGGIRDFHAVDTRTLYVQDTRGRWYRATTFGRCTDLPFAQAIGFETRGGDTFDRWSSIRVRGERCTLRSVVRSDPPPSRRDTRRG